MINVEGDSIGAGIVNKMSKEDLRKQDEEMEGLGAAVVEGEENKAFEAREDKYDEKYTKRDPDYIDMETSENM